VTDSEFLTRSFFENDSDQVARELIGSRMVLRDEHAVRFVRIVETEAYGGLDDPASHAFRGPTPRTRVMFGPAGVLYVYRSYGIHWCLNVVTGPAGHASAVLIRAGEIVERTPLAGAPETCSVMLRGPGVFTRELGITGADNGEECCRGADARFAFLAREDEKIVVAASARIGLSRARERLSRYVEAGHPAVSKFPTPRSPKSI
jgi:DNA-3-methyladenine glycosylase